MYHDAFRHYYHLQEETNQKIMLDPYVGDLHVGFPMQLQIKWNGTYYDIVHFMDEKEARDPQCYSPQFPYGGHSLAHRFEDKNHPVSGSDALMEYDTLRSAIADYMSCAIYRVTEGDSNVFAIQPVCADNGILDKSIFYGGIVRNGPSSQAMPVINRILSLAKPHPIDFEAGPLSCRLTPMTEEPHFFAASASDA